MSWLIRRSVTLQPIRPWASTACKSSFALFWAWSRAAARLDSTFSMEDRLSQGLVWLNRGDGWDLRAGYSASKGLIQRVQRKAEENLRKIHTAETRSKARDSCLRRGRLEATARPRMAVLVASSVVEARKLLLEMLYLWQVEGG